MRRHSRRCDLVWLMQSGCALAPAALCVLQLCTCTLCCSALQDQDVLVRHGVQVRVIGDLSLAPASVQEAAAKVMDATRHHTKAVLNICFSYT